MNPTENPYPIQKPQNTAGIVMMMFAFVMVALLAVLLIPSVEQQPDLNLAQHSSTTALFWTLLLLLFCGIGIYQGLITRKEAAQLKYTLTDTGLSITNPTGETRVIAYKTMQDIHTIPTLGGLSFLVFADRSAPTSSFGVDYSSNGFFSFGGFATGGVLPKGRALSRPVAGFYRQTVCIPYLKKDDAEALKNELLTRVAGA